MHDVVHDVATRIAKSKEKSIFSSGHGISKTPEIENIRCICFVDNNELVLPKDKKDFPRVTTLLLCYNKDDLPVPKEFLEGFQALRVLNMPQLRSSLPLPLHLPDLRGLFLKECGSDLVELPCGSKLMVLDLSSSRIYKLPRGMEKLTSFRMLVLRDTPLKTIEADVIRGLSALEMLDTKRSRWPTMENPESKEVVLQDLARLGRLKEVYLDLTDVEATYEESSWLERLEMFAFSYDIYDSCAFTSEDFSHGLKHIAIFKIEGNKVWSFILHANWVSLVGIFGEVNEMFANFSPYIWSKTKLKDLSIMGCSLSENLTRPIPNFSTLKHLSFLEMEQIKSFYQIANALGRTFPKLRSLDLNYNRDLEVVLPLDYYHEVTPNLEEIILNRCNMMSTVFHDGPSETQAIIPKLKTLQLIRMESLQSLCSCGSSEHWQSLEFLEVCECPNLKKLPHMTSIKEIKGKKEWWNDLECDSPESKSYMTQFFKPYNW